MGARELAKLGLADGTKVVDGTVVRQRAAYPVYDRQYHARSRWCGNSWSAKCQIFNSLAATACISTIIRTMR